MANELVSVSEYRGQVDNREEAFSEAFRALDEVFGDKKHSEIDKIINTLGLNEYLQAEQYSSQDAAANIIAVANLKKQKSIEDERRKENYRKMTWLLTPIWTTILTFVFITWLGGYLQEASFARNAVFDVKLERFREAQSLATEAFFDIRDIKYRIDAEGNVTGRYDDFVRSQMDQIQRLEDIVRGFEVGKSTTVNQAIIDAQENLYHHLTERHDIDLIYIDKLRDEISIELIHFLDSSR